MEKLEKYQHVLVEKSAISGHKEQTNVIKTIN